MKQHLDPNAVWLFFVSTIARWLVLLVFLSAWLLVSIIEMKELNSEISFRLLNLLWIIIPAFLAASFAWAKLTYHFYYYEMTEDGFRKELGVIWKKYVTIPYDRIQNVDIYRGIIARLLGLSDLHVQTAGASAQYSRYGALALSAEGRLPGLSREIADQLRDELVRRAKNPKSQGL